MTAVEDPRLVALLEGVSGSRPRAAHLWTAQSLRRALALGLFADRLPPERHLADTLGVSRITVRLALRALRDAGEVRSRPGRAGGSFPATPPATGADASVIASARADIADILAFRGAIEPMAASWAAQERDPETLARLERSIETMGAEPSQRAFADSDSEFHLAIAEATKSPRLLHALLVTRADLLLWRRRLPQLNYDPSYARANCEEHLAIAQAIRAGDGRAAFDAMAWHLDLAQTAFRRVLEA
jgi:GntR family transcriptional repressor for pyruvate dehydrogenase complex